MRPTLAASVGNEKFIDEALYETYHDVLGTGEIGEECRLIAVGSRTKLALLLAEGRCS